MKQAVRVMRLDDIQEGVPAGVVVEGIELVVLRAGGEVRLFEGRCPHAGSMLAEGSVEYDTLVCAAHGWRFNRASGQKVGDPTICLKTFAAIVEDGYVLADPDELRRWKRQSTAGLPVSAATSPAYRTIEQLPGPKGLPLFGNSLGLDMSQLHRTLEQWGRIYGSLFTFRIGPKRILVTARPSMINAMLRQRPQTFRRNQSIEPTMREMGMAGVFAVEGDDWRRQRPFVTQALDIKHLRQFFPTLLTVTERLRQRWRKAGQVQQSVDVQADLMRYTVDLTTNLAFGYDINTLEHSGDVVQQHLEKVFPALHHRTFMPIRYWRYIKLPADRALDRSLAEVCKTIDEFIGHARARLASDPDLARHPTNFLESLLAAHGEDGSQFTDDEIIANVFTMLLAGEDTTANTIAWALFFLNEHPDIHYTLRDELDATLEPSGLLRDMQQARQLPYLDAVINETMRLKPVAPVLNFTANEDVELDGLAIPRGTPILGLARLGVLDESAFEDAQAFRPERWLVQDGAAHPQNHPAYVPFGGGPRLCPGRNLALLEMKIALAMICHTFDLSRPAQAAPVTEHLAFTMMPAQLMLQFEERDMEPVC